MRRLCPTISELNAFHSAAKHLAFTMAARELCVTQSAISRHIAALEDYLGQKLFIRKATGLELTEAGATYLNATRPAMAALESATAQLMSYGGDGGSLNLSVPPTFAAQWLFPRLGHFKRTLPQVSLNFVRYQYAHDFATPHEFDAAIQYGYGSWPSANARNLIGKETSIFCSPQLRDTLPLHTPQDLLRATLLQHIEVPLGLARLYGSPRPGHQRQPLRAGLQPLLAHHPRRRFRLWRGHRADLPGGRRTGSRLAGRAVEKPL